MALTLVDTHVHFHTCFCPRRVIEGAWKHIERVRAERGAEAVFGCLVSTEIGSGDPVGRLWRAVSDLAPPWTAVRPRERGALILTRGRSPAIAVVPGRQVVTQEGLEVLAVATTAHPEEGRTLVDTVRSIRAAGGVAVLPWGFGKWSFERGRQLDAFLAEPGVENRVFLGDNGCRPRTFATLKPLSRGILHGVRVLAGSDPLPFRDHESRAASYGTLLPGEVDWERPAAWLRSRLLNLDRSPEIAGRGRGVHEFVHDQIRLRRRPGVAA